MTRLDLTERDLRRLSVGELVDLHGNLKRRLDRTTDNWEMARKEILRRGIENAKGVEYETTVTRSWRTTINAQALRDEFGDKWLKKYQRKVPLDMVTTVRRKSREEAVANGNGKTSTRKR